MTLNEFTCPADMNALNTEVELRKITPELLASIMLIERPSGSGMGSIEAQFHVVYWDPLTK